MVDIRIRSQTRLLAAQLDVHAAYERLAREEKEASREKRPIPRHLRDRLEADIRDAKLALGSARAAAEAVNRFPPIARFA